MKLDSLPLGFLQLATLLTQQALCNMDKSPQAYDVITM